MRAYSELLQWAHSFAAEGSSLRVMSWWIPLCLWLRKPLQFWWVAPSVIVAVALLMLQHGLGGSSTVVLGSVAPQSLRDVDLFQTWHVCLLFSLWHLANTLVVARGSLVALY